LRAPSRTSSSPAGGHGKKKKKKKKDNANKTSSSSSSPSHLLLPECEVWCCVAKPIHGVLSPNKLNDLLFVLLNLNQPPPPPPPLLPPPPLPRTTVGGTAGGAGAAVDASSASAASSSALPPLQSTPRFDEDEDDEDEELALLALPANELLLLPHQQQQSTTSTVNLNPFAVQLRVTASVAAVRLTLTSEEENVDRNANNATTATGGGAGAAGAGGAGGAGASALFTLSVEGLALSLEGRPYDSTIRVDLKSLQLKDLTQQQRRILPTTTNLDRYLVSSEPPQPITSGGSGITTTATPAVQTKPMIRVNLLTTTSSLSPLVVEEMPNNNNNNNNTATPLPVPPPLLLRGASGASGGGALSVGDSNSKRTCGGGSDKTGDTTGSTMSKANTVKTMSFVGRSVEVSFGSLRANLNPSALRQVKPFYSALMQAGQKSSTGAIGQATANTAAAAAVGAGAAEIGVPADEKMQTNNLDGGRGNGDSVRMEVSVSVEEISAELVSEEKVATSDSWCYTSVVRASIAGLQCGVGMDGGNGGMVVDLALDAVTLIDVRPEATSEYHFRHLIAPASLAGVVVDGREKGAPNAAVDVCITGEEEEDDEDTITPLLMLRYVSTPPLPPSSSSSSSADNDGGGGDDAAAAATAAAWTSTSGSVAESVVDITLSEFKSFLIVPSIAAAVDVSLDVVAALQDMIDLNEGVGATTNGRLSSGGVGKMASANNTAVPSIKNDSSRDHGGNDDETVTEEATRGGQGQEGKGKGTGPCRTVMKVGLQLVNPSLVLVGDPSKADSAGVVLEARMRLDVVLDSTIEEGVGLLSNTKATLAVESMEAFVSLDVRIFFT
jgi:hypothetical protein